MATAITPVSQYDDTLTTPENGDDLDADVVAAALQVLGDRALLARDGLLGLLSGAEVLEVPAGGTLTSFTLSLGNIRGVVLTCGDGATRCLADSTISVTEADIEGGGGTLGAVAQWWHVYAYAATTTLAYEISTTAPTADLVWKAGSVGTKRYLGCFPTTGSGAPIALRKCRGRYLYSLSDLGATALRVLTAGSATSYTDVDLSGFVPPHGRRAELSAYLIPNTTVATSIGSATLRKNGAGSAGVVGIECGTGTQWPSVERVFSLECDSSQLVEYRVAGTNAPTINVDVIGFEE